MLCRSLVFNPCGFYQKWVTPMLEIKAAPKNKNVARGRFEYSHSPDNRALTKPYLVTTYLVAN